LQIFGLTAANVVYTVRMKRLMIAALLFSCPLFALQEKLFNFQSGTLTVSGVQYVSRVAQQTPNGVLIVGKSVLMVGLSTTDPETASFTITVQYEDGNAIHSETRIHQCSDGETLRFFPAGRVRSISVTENKATATFDMPN
jgi:hypothetical protein